ncbi:MAG TPA: anhydro-N-acetylmuramic acid kinase [Burkholderiaceae bacterium]|nr:anhydro-N-acetylmuramic acid kinase [Burkholderiaceae bacterium]
MSLYIGLMSGTSLDGVDGVIAEFDEAGTFRLKGHHHEPFGAALHDELLALNTAGHNELHRAALAANAVARAYASVVTTLLYDTSTAARDVRAIGAHGQTVRHQPGAFDGIGYTCQLINGALLAEATGIDVVCDLRSRDVAAGGQGAPLAPAFHADVFGDASEARAVLNLGGIANLTLLQSDQPVIGFDTGPANVLMDAWCLRHRREPFDAGGAWAAGGQASPSLLSSLLSEPYFALSPPKSTGRDLFHMDWLDAHLAEIGAPLVAVDVQATLAALTVESVAAGLERHAPAVQALCVCGGGARNGHLLQRLAARLPHVRVRTTDELGLPADQVEATAFAWLAHRFVERRSGNLPEVTGARGPRLLGALYPA